MLKRIPRPRPYSGLKRALPAFFTLVAALAVVACGGGGIEGGEETGDAPTAEGQGEATGELTVSNWPFYIDRNTVPEFEKETGLSVKYVEDVNDNVEFFGKMQPLLDQGESGGRDIFVVTDWMAKRMYDLGYLQNFDKDAVQPALDNLLPQLRTPAFDPDRNYSLPWQSGLAGLIVNTDEAPDVTSVNDLFDPKYEGQVTMLSEMRDTVPMVMMADGVDPENATTEEWMAAIDKLREGIDSGQIRRITGNDYTRDLASGDAVAVIGWSGDAVQLRADDPAIEFRVPDEGCTLWSDNMVIPVGAPNPTAAYEWMNYVYEPENQAQIAEYNYYVTPAEGTQEVLEKQGSPAAKSDLVFPSEQYIAECIPQPEPPGDLDDVREVERAFQALVTGG